MMAPETGTIPPILHPSPHRGGAAAPGLLFAVWAGPMAWAIQIVAIYALAAYPCFAAGAARLSVLPNWRWEWPPLLAINIATIVLAFVGAGLSAHYWRMMRREHAGGAGHPTDTGEERTRFLALCGLMANFGFLAVIVSNTISLFMVPQCSG